MVYAGLSAVIGSWNTIAMRSPRSALMRRAPARVRSSPRKAMRPALRTAARGSRPMIAREVIDLPQPDSPTMHSVSPRFTWKDTSRTGCTTPEAVRMSTRRPSTCRTGAASAALMGHEHLVQAVAGEIDREDQQRQRAAGDRDQPEREEHVLLGLGDHQAPGRQRRLHAQA